MLFSKKAGLTLFVLLVLVGMFYVSAALDSTKAWHPLQQIATTLGSGKSVDDNNNGLIDDADKVGGLSAAELQAAAGGAGTGKSFHVVIFEDDDACPSGFNKLSNAEASRTDGYVHLRMTNDNLFFGALNDWAVDGGQSAYLGTRLPPGWAGFVCWKTYDVSGPLIPRSTVIPVKSTTSCPAGYNIYEHAGATGNGWVYVVQSEFGLFIGQLDWWDMASSKAGTTMLRQWYNKDHAGKTCWNVFNVS